MAIRRIPYADKNKVEKLPAEAKNILGFMKKVVPINEYKELENSIVGFSEGSQNPVGSEKSVYGGELQDFGAVVMSSLGVYNPDKIPLDIYERMSKDPTIALGLSVIKYTPIGLNWRIDCDDEKQRYFLTKSIKKTYRETVLSLTDATRLGIAAGEKVWNYETIKVFSKSKKKKLLYDDNFWQFDKIKFVNPKTIRIRIDKKGNFLGISQRNPFSGTYTFIDKNQIVLYSHNLKFGNWFGESRLQNVYPSWYWSMVLTHFMLKYYERRGQPLTLMRYPAGTRTDIYGNKVDNASHALKIGQAAMSNSVVTLPSESDKNSQLPIWDMSYIKDDQRGEMFMSILNHMDSRKLRGMFIPDRMGLASDGSPHATGGASAGDTLDVFIMTEQSLINDIENVYDTQIIPDLQNFNFKEEEISEATLKIEKLDYNKKILMKDVLLRMIMMSAGTLRDGKAPKILPSMAKLAEILDIPLDTFDDMFEKVEAPGLITPTSTTGDNIQNNPNPTVAKKNIQDKNNQNRGTSRKDRPTRDRSIREKG